MTKRFRDGMAVKADGTPDPEVDHSDVSLLEQAGVLTSDQIAALADDLSKLAPESLSALLDALLAVAGDIDPNTVTAAGIVTLTSTVNVLGAIRAEVAVRGSEADQRAANAAAMVASIRTAGAAGSAAAARLPSISRLAARQPARTRPQALTASAPLVASAGGVAINVDRVAEVMAEGVRREWAGRGKWSGDRATLMSLRADAPEARQLGQDEIGNAAKIEAVTSLSALTASGGICGPTDVSFAVQSIATADRPLQGAMAGFQATRGGLRYSVPATLAQLTADGPSAIWTEANDVTPTNPTTKPHALFACQPVFEAYVDAITSIVQFSNFQGEICARTNGVIYVDGQCRARAPGRGQCVGAAQQRLGAGRRRGL